MSNHDTLNVSLQTDNRRYDSRISKTIEIDNKSSDQGDGPQTDDRVRRFRQLYYRNEKLRKELKNLNLKLNQRLDKVKFPSVKKRATSVDLNYNPPSKALMRELENASKQVKMYKKQVQILKIKEQTPENYEKVKNMENAVAYKDIEIASIQKEIISIKNIKKLQQKKILSDLQNQQVKERLEQYQREHKQLKQRLKQIAKESRKKEEAYKKQQAYAISLEKKVREVEKNEDEEEQKEDFIIQKQIPRQISEIQFKRLKDQIAQQKKVNDQCLKKIQIAKKGLNKEKRQQNSLLEKYKDKDALSKNLGLKIQALNRLIREEQRRPKTPPVNKLITKVEQISLDDESNEGGDNHQPPTISKDDQSLRRMLNEMNQMEKQEERNWKGKFRKIQNGFGLPNDHKFQLQGELMGFKICQDENQSICGLICIFKDKNGKREENVQGKRSNIELQWIVNPNEKIAKLYGSFTEQSYLNELVIVSDSGRSGVFGSAAQDSFNIDLKENERISGCFGAYRELGQDRRITELGFWIQRNQ